LAEQLVEVGKVSGVFGVKGWVKVHSYTSPRENILNYSPWRLSRGGEVKEIKVLEGRQQGKTLVARLDGINDREAAELLSGWRIDINSQQLPKTADDEYYWSELIGLNVKTTTGIELGIVDYLIETGANDVLVVAGDRERLIPFLQGQTIVSIDTDNQLITVDWDADF